MIIPNAWVSQKLQRMHFTEDINKTVSEEAQTLDFLDKHKPHPPQLCSKAKGDSGQMLKDTRTVCVGR